MLDNERECFDALPREELGLLPASAGAYRGLVFVNPSPSPKDDFSAWIANLRAHTWAPPQPSSGRRSDGNGAKSKAGKRGSYILPNERPVRLADLDSHPLESGNFQLEDMWIVEKVQRNLHSPHFQVGPMARGPGAETPLTEFQRQVLDFVPMPS